MLSRTLGLAFLLVTLLGGTVSSQTNTKEAAPARAAEADEQPPAPNYVHPLGLAVRHPVGWRVEEMELGLALIPPDLARSLPPRELYLLNAVGIPRDVLTLDDPRVAQRLTEVLRATVPFMQPKGKPEAVRTVAGARTYRWSGVNPLNGQAIVATVHGKAEQGYFLSVGAVGEQALVERRAPELLAIFESYAWTSPKLEPRLVGSWNSDSYHSSGSSSSDRINLSHRQTVVLLADGRMRSSSQMGVSGRTGGDDRPGSDITGIVHGEPELGRWAAEGQYVYALWHDGGAVKYSYYIQGSPGRREMLLTPIGGGAKTLWTEY